MDNSSYRSSSSLAIVAGLARGIGQAPAPALLARGRAQPDGTPTSTKRELTKRYKASLPPMGVYVIRNRVNGRVFIGASLNVDAAINRHRFELRLNSHRHRDLLRDWQQFGADNMRFEVLDLIGKQDDPAFDYPAELATMLALWSEELGCGGDSDNLVLQNT